MFKTEKIFLILLTSICLIISIVILDSAIDPALLIRTVYARFTEEPKPTTEGIYIPDQEDEVVEVVIDEVSTTLQEGWDLFRSEGFAFEIQFPKEVVQKSILNQSALNSGVGVNPEAPVWEFRLDNFDLYKGTNLVDASILVHVLEGKDKEADCAAFKPGSIYQTPKEMRDSLISVEINGVPFWKDEVIEGVMGEFYHRISYRTFNKGACYEMTELLHYQNNAGFIDEEVAEFDKAEVIAKLDQVLETFKFLDVEPTFPEVSYPLPMTMSAAVAKSTSANVDGIDVSHWQGDIGWMKVAGAGYEFAFAKGTEGVGWTDSMFHQNMAEAVNAGVYTGIYHFARPDLGNTGAEEANYFLSVAGDYLKSGYLRPVLDLEVGTSLGKAALSSWVVEWMETVKNRTGISPLLYTNPNFLNYYLNISVTEYDLWVAHWTCEPEPSYNVPNTGAWRDWGFWQYYGPGGCGGNAGYVPGISTNIDLNIFNGVSAGMQEFDALSDLWVSLSSDAYYVAAPYYADITGNVNGDTTGLIDFAFWWDCTALEADLGVVEGICGTLPIPAEGECEYNESGMRCVAVENEKQLAEHTYQEVGNYTAKVIVSRGAEAPVEDRYKISTYNPLRTSILEPASPTTGYVGETFTLNADVTIHTSVEGALQVSVENTDSAILEGEQCISLIGDNESTENFVFSLQESEATLVNYEISTRYRPWGECPVEDVDDNDMVQSYQIDWIDEQPVLILKDDAGDEVASGATVDLGDAEPYQVVNLAFQVSNPSGINPLQIVDAVIENAVNVVNIQVLPAAPIEVGPQAEIPLEVSFEIQASGAFSFDVVLEHDASNPTPYLFKVVGNGVLTANPIQSIDPQPASPVSSFVNEDFGVSVDVDLDAPVAGVLQVSILDQEDNPIQNPVCLTVAEAGQGVHSFDFSWTELAPGLLDYQIIAQYRDSGECPIEDVNELDISQGYLIDWQEDNPVMELKNIDDQSLPSGSSEDLGDLVSYKVQSEQFLVSNPTTTNEFQIVELVFNDLVNVINPEVDISTPITVGPGEELMFVITFEIENPGDFSFDVDLEHDASNPTPFNLNILGNGILESDPIQSITPEPLSPGEKLIGEVFGLNVNTAYNAPIEGSLVVSLHDENSNPVQDPVCYEIAAIGAGTEDTSFDWSETGAALNNYTIIAQFYPRSGCPAAGDPISELSMSYQVDWLEELPVLEITEEDGTLISSDETINLGEFEYYQTVDLTYLIKNLSSTSSLEVTGIRLEDLVNVGNADTNPEAGFILDPEAENLLDISFLIDSTGTFSFDLVIEHLASNPSPYRITFEGSSIMTNNPIKFIVPTPPTPGSSLIGSPYPLRIEVGMDAPDTGSLQVSVIDKTDDQVKDNDCLLIEDNLDQARTFNLSWTNADIGSVDYSVQVQYRAQGVCPVAGAQDSDLTQTYVVKWDEDKPELEVKEQGGTLVSSGDIIDMGQKGYYQNVELAYTLSNNSTTSSMKINDIGIDNLVNLDGVTVDPSGQVVLGPGEELIVNVLFQVTELGSFSFDLVVDHDAINANPYRFSIQGAGELSENPIYGMTLIPVSPAEMMTSEVFDLKVESEINPPAPGAMEIIVFEDDTDGIVGSTCISVPGEHSLLNVDLNWTRIMPGDVMYRIQLGYHAGGSCPTTNQPDAVVEENYQVSWQIHKPVLIVNRPEGVTIFDGAVDFVGEHEFFRFVEVTYVIENNNDSAPLVIDSIQAENLENLREVIIDPLGPITIGPGESQVIKINFQVLMLEPFSFDLVWEHNGSNANPYKTGIEGTSKLYLGDGVPEQSWLFRFIDSLIRSGFFLKIPSSWTGS